MSQLEENLQALDWIDALDAEVMSSIDARPPDNLLTLAWEPQRHTRIQPTRVWPASDRGLSGPRLSIWEGGERGSSTLFSAIQLARRIVLKTGSHAFIFPFGSGIS